jgi:hypothetical protein
LLGCMSFTPSTRHLVKLGEASRSGSRSVFEFRGLPGKSGADCGWVEVR